MSKDPILNAQTVLWARHYQLVQKLARVSAARFTLFPGHRHRRIKRLERQVRRFALAAEGLETGHFVQAIKLLRQIRQEVLASDLERLAAERGKRAE